MDAEPEKDASDAVDMGKVKGHIELRNVTYGYGEGTDVLKNVSLDIGVGKTFALVGPSGGGKTTICHLIPVFTTSAQEKFSLTAKRYIRLRRSHSERT